MNNKKQTIARSVGDKTSNAAECVETLRREDATLRRATDDRAQYVEVDKPQLAYRHSLDDSLALVLESHSLRDRLLGGDVRFAVGDDDDDVPCVTAISATCLRSIIHWVT